MLEYVRQHNLPFIISHITSSCVSMIRRKMKNGETMNTLSLYK